MKFFSYLIAITTFNSVLTFVDGRRNLEGPQFFICNDGVRLKYQEYCDGIAQCSGGEDEINGTNNSQDWHRCYNHENTFDGFCQVHKDQICNGEVFCSNLSPCDLRCETHYRCNNGTCLLRSTVCDQDPCSGCQEDHGWTNGVGFKCSRNGFNCILPQQLLYDDVSDCDNDADICFHENDVTQRGSNDDLIKEKCFLCLDGNMIISTASVCDGVIDCSDLSDECLCATSRPSICNQVVDYKFEIGNRDDVESSTDGSTSNCKAGQIRCRNGKCIARESICDGVKDCDEDENHEICQGTVPCKDASGTEQCRCALDRSEKSCRAVSATACDGLGECPPAQIHGWQTWTLETFPEDECNATCSRDLFTCELTQSIHYRKKLYGTWCDVPDNATGAYTMDIEGWQYCDGVVDCELSGSDEIQCDIDDCGDLGCIRFHCNAKRPGYVSIRDDQVCDGIIDCTDGEDEDAALCNDRNGLLRFNCPVLNDKRVSINKKFQCDSVINCDDASDEMDCDDGRFYCENGDAPIFVPKSAVKDGKADCSDWSDECPSLDGSTRQNAFSSRYEMIENRALRVLVWIMGFLAAVGNIIVIFHESKKLRNPGNKVTPAIKANRILILNLACSDFLMGVYLLSLGSIALKMQGDYCSKDIEWRTSSFCASLGILSVISGQTSVMTMAVLTGCRLYAVLKPFETSSRPTKKSIILMVLLCWITALTLALLPLSSHLAHIFIAGVDFVFNPFVSGISTPLETAKKVFLKISSYSLLSNSTQVASNLDSFVAGASWSDLSEKGDIIGIEYFKAKTFYGYYSAASVCIPKFFITMSDPAWVFSFIVNVFNIFAFSFVAVAYFIIYFKSKKDSALKGALSRHERKQMKQMQRKVIRLVATDFACWVPICIMAFVKLAGVHVSDTAYAFSAIVLLPLNSALNPILYSDFLDIVIQRICNAFIRSFGEKNGTSSVRSRLMHLLTPLRRSDRGVKEEGSNESPKRSDGSSERKNSRVASKESLSRV